MVHQSPLHFYFFWELVCSHIMSLADAGEMSDEELRQYHRSLLEWQRIARTERLKALDEMDRRYGSDTNDTE